MTILKESSNFRLAENRGAIVLEVKTAKAYPKRRKMSRADAEYLKGLKEDSFDAAAVWDFGVGAFASK